MRSVWFIVEVALVLVGGQVVLAPFVLYSKIRQAAKPEFLNFDLLNPPLLLPPSYTQNIALLEELDFHAVAYLVGAGPATSLRSVLTLFVNQSAKEMAIVHMLSKIPPVTRPVANYVEFYTHFEDGSEICTGNSKQASAFVEVPEKKIFRLAHIADLKQLYAFHRATVNQRPKTNKRLPPDGEEVTDLVRTMQRDLAREASFGRMKLDPSGLWYRLTVKGAILYSLKFAWPVGSLRRHLQRWRGKRLARAVLKDQ